MIQAALAIVVVTLIKFNYAQTSSCVEKNLEDSLLMSWQNDERELQTGNWDNIGKANIYLNYYEWKEGWNGKKNTAC